MQFVTSRVVGTCVPDVPPISRLTLGPLVRGLAFAKQMTDG